MKKTAAALLVMACTTAGYSQTLFTYGNKPVSKDEFLKAYNKNNTAEKPTEQSYREYLDLYIRFKIKVQAALDKRLDTLANQQAELQGFRNQVIESYIKDEASVNLLIDEAFERSLKDIHVAHIFVSAPATATEEQVKTAQQKINEAYSQLQKKQDFGVVAVNFSEDPTVKNNRGDIGYITAFVLPYSLETAIYNTPVGSFSAPVRSKNGFHLFKVIDERKAAGKLKAAQILLTFPPDATAAQRQQVKQQADSIYNVLQNGGDFKELALQFSGDNITYQTGGEMMEFGVGRYEPAFETAAFALAENGAISKPVLTEYGYHIVKRLDRKPVIDDKNNSAWREQLKQQVQSTDRIQVSQKILVKKIMQWSNYKKASFNEKNLWTLTDSVLKNGSHPAFADLKPGTPLFSFAKQTIAVKDWETYLQMIRNYESQHAGKSRPELFNEFTETAALEYYRNHLEEYSKDFAYQLNEFREGNLLFEIMQRNVWDAASADSTGLKKYYDEHKDKYWWEASADAIIFTATTQAVADEAKKKLRSNYKSWQQYIDGSDGRLQGDSGRFELGQIPVLERTNFTPGLITADVKNENDNSITFAYIITVHRERQPRTFADARGFVINDYQTHLEEKWITELKKKYPVKINEATLKNLPK
jgi:peptidyl-prolyl cis-trans isomerase SurA